MSRSVKVIGPEGSSYVRTLRLALEEKGVAHALVELPPPDYKGDDYRRDWHPFGKVPAIEIDGFRLYETQAIVRLIDDLYPDPPLVPPGPFQRARMNQVVGIVDCYAWTSMAAGVVWNRIILPELFGEQGNETEVEQALPLARTSMKAIAALLEGPYFAGDDLSIADLFVYPILDYFRRAPEGTEILREHPRMLDWIALMDSRQSSRRLLAA